MDVPTDSHQDESFLHQLAHGEKHNQWPPNANVITYELRGLDEEARQQAPTLATTTRAMQGNLQAEKEMDGQGEYSSYEAPNLSDLERVTKTTRRTAKALERENEIL